MPDELAAKLGDVLGKKGLRLAIAESCTGGLVSKLVTDVPGSSRYFAGAVCAYSDEAKVKLLGVPRALIAGHGAVSPEVAEAMAECVRQKFSADVGIGITGIAGPGGGTMVKPVGLVHIAVSIRGRLASNGQVFDGGRERVRGEAARAALQTLLDKVNTA